jgi:hypothetical protein
MRWRAFFVGLSAIVLNVGSSAVIGERENELANKWIKELSDAGYTTDEMIAVFREARRKYEDYKNRKTQRQCKKH